MSSLSFNNQSDSFSSDLNGFKKSQAHYQKNNRIIKVKCRKDKCLSSYHQTENSESTDH